MLTLTRRYDLECGHRLTGGLPRGHRCRRPHGHTYKATLYVSGLPDKHGVLIEYADLDAVVLPVLDLADHHNLNTITRRVKRVTDAANAQATKLAANPTVERLAMWIWQSLAGRIERSKPAARRLRLTRVSVMEDDRSGAEWAPAFDVHPSQRRDDNG